MTKLEELKAAYDALDAALDAADAAADALADALDAAYNAAEDAAYDDYGAALAARNAAWVAYQEELEKQDR